ncbi:UNVERIFIED_ORG: hypothetical protein GGE44_005061 [Rhizobium esperanzae]
MYFLLLWGLWVTGFNWLLWLGIYVLMLPRVLAVSTIAVKSLQQTEASFLATRRIATVLLDRGVRALIIAFAAIWLGQLLGVGADTMAAGDKMVDKIARGVIGGIVILLAADLLWHVVKVTASCSARPWRAARRTRRRPDMRGFRRCCRSSAISLPWSSPSLRF